jgi:hypothetical protein
MPTYLNIDVKDAVVTDNNGHTRIYRDIGRRL